MNQYMEIYIWNWFSRMYGFSESYGLDMDGCGWGSGDGYGYGCGLAYGSPSVLGHGYGEIE